MAYHPFAANNAANKENERALTTLTRAGLVRRFRSRGTRTIHVQVTDVGDQTGRALCDLPGVDHAVRQANKLYEFRTHRLAESQQNDRPDFDPLRPWVAEIAFVAEALPDVEIRDWPDIPKQDWPSVIIFVVDQFRCAAVRGWVSFNSDAHRRTWYCLTPAGLQVATGDIVPSVSPELPVELEGAFDEYQELKDRHFESLIANTEPTGEIGACPLSCSILTLAAAAKLLTEQNRKKKRHA
jgi:hypothetical protein